MHMELRQPESSDAARDAALREERAYAHRLYTRLDTVREEVAAALREAHGRDTGRAVQALVEREVTADEQAHRLARLSGVEHGLCFGRIDQRGPGTDDTLYIGRVGLRDADREPLLIDWRAPAARPFYTATPGSPGPVTRRRHLHTRHRTVVDVDDEVFDLDGLDAATRSTLVGEAALLATLRRGRTGRMHDIVSTIQAEQDRVIRSGLSGVLVVQGGPGTGKTVAALHRAAYLLYTHRDTLARRGVLVVAPGATFARYIEQVLPSLGETDVVLRTVGDLFPGVHATATDPPETAVVKGDPRMVALLGAAIADRQRVPPDDLWIAAEELPLHAERDTCARAREHARARDEPHNVARRTFVWDILRAVVRDRAQRLGRPLDEEEEHHAPGELWAQPEVRGAIDALWPELTPQRLLTDLFTDPDALHRAAAEAGFTTEQRTALLRAASAPWTTADVPLLDEAAELLGVDDSADRARQRAAEHERREEERYARGVLQITGLDELGLVDAGTLAARHRDDGPRTSTAQRAGADRTWVYGHVIVDEAQELSPMAWRAVLRRIPSRSLTVVGDVAQTGNAAGARSWTQALDPHLHGRWREERLLVNYRTPVEIMRVAADVLRAVAPGQEPPESVRDEQGVPRAVRITRDDLPARLPGMVDAELTELGAGRLAVLAPDALLGAVHRALPDAAVDATPDTLDFRTVVLTPAQAKGLEFDVVLVLDPSGILAGSPTGGHDLYVAITRSTRRLTVIHHEDLPPMLHRLAPS